VANPIDFCCSFCGKPRRQVAVLISGPRVFICDECVGICVDVLVDEKSKGRLEVIGERVDAMAKLQAERDEAQDELGKLRRIVKRIEDALGPPPVKIKCLWCNLDLESRDVAKEHVGSCEKHPAVIKLAESSRG
jgi:hypothetical protein